MLELPVINLETLRSGTPAERRAAADALGTACRETGFFCVSGHGISAASRDSLFQAAREFFGLSVERKNELSIARSRRNRGYVGVGAERLQVLPDQKEAFNIGLDLPPDTLTQIAANGFSHNWQPR